MKADFHLHTAFSGDSDTPPEEVIRTAVRKGLSMLCFTDHLDADYPYKDVSSELDTDSYFSVLQALQKQWEPQIALRIGVELGLQAHLKDFCRSYVSRYPFDFVIGSTHVVDRQDPYYPDFWESCSPRDAISRFLEVTLENINAIQDFDIYGHLDYIVRYAPMQEKKFIYTDHADLADEILKTLIQNGKGIEVNTGGYKAGLGVPNPCPDLLCRYRELGGEIITTGSDAHFPQYVGFCFDEVQELLRSCGFRYFTVFKERKAEFLPL